MKDWFAESFIIRHGIILLLFHARLSLKVCRRQKIFGYFCHAPASKGIYKYRRHEMRIRLLFRYQRESLYHLIRGIRRPHAVEEEKKTRWNRSKRKKEKKMRLHPILQRGAVIDREIGWGCAGGKKLLPSLQIRDTRDVHLYRELLTVVGRALPPSIVISPLSIIRYSFALVTQISINIRVFATDALSASDYK